MRAVDVQLDVQPVVLQQDARELPGVLPVSGELRRVRKPGLRPVGEDGHEPDAGAFGRVAPSGFVIGVIVIAGAGLAQRIGGDVGVGALRERDRFVEKIVRPRDHAPRARRVDAAGPWAGFGAALLAGDDVGAVQRIVEAAPAGVGGIERVAGVVDRHDELGAGDPRDLVVDVRGVDLKLVADRGEVADGFQECAVLGRIDGLRRALLMPCVDPRLEPAPPFEQRAVLRPEVPDDVRERAPERLGLDPGSGGDLVPDQIVQPFGDVEAADFHSLAHRSLSCIVCPRDRAPRIGTG